MMLLAYAIPLAKTGEAAKAGPIGLAVILLLCIACYFLFKSMAKHMRKVRENFPGEVPPPGQRDDQRTPDQRISEQRIPDERSDDQQHREP